MSKNIPAGEPPNLGDVARRAGVSMSTASRALSGKSLVSQKTRERVKAVAAQMHYRPNPFMRTLMTTRRMSKRLPFQALLAWVDVNLDADTWKIWEVERLAYEGALARARSRGYELERFFRREPKMSADRFMQVLEARGVHGALFSNAHLLAERKEPLPVDPERFALVAVGCRVEKPNLNFAMNDCFATAREGHLRMRAAGYRRTALVTAHFIECFVDHRFVGGFRSALESQDEVHKAPVLYIDDFDLTKFADWMREQDADSALFTCFSSRREPFLKQLARLPKSFGYAISDFDTQQPEVAGVNQCHAQVGAAAVDMLIHQLEHSEVGLPLRPHGVMIEGVWVDGASAPGLKVAPVAARSQAK